ncbi:MAG: hypothetical protein V7K34_10530 [Nostoc sp.]
MSAAVLLTFITVGLIPQEVKAQPPACSSTYNPPATVQERRKAGWFDGRVGRAAFRNTAAETTFIITLYHPDNRAPFGWYVFEPKESANLDKSNYGSDWGIQIGDGPICLIGRVSTYSAKEGFVVTPQSMGIDPSLLLDDLREREDGFRIRENGRVLSRQGRRKDAVKQLAYAADVFRVQKKFNEERATRNELNKLMR